MKDRLFGTYEKIRDILGDQTESFESVQLVEDYRQYWKPEKIRIVLLAESHVYTSDEDLSITIPEYPDLPGYPKNYARFVYCLGYGEREFTQSHLHPKRDGTPQFWKLLYSCNTEVTFLKDFWPILSHTPYSERIVNKIRLLNDLRLKGVWLIDASIIALYCRGKKVSRMYEALKASWYGHTLQVVVDAKPEYVICIGKGVAQIVEEDLKKRFHGAYEIFPQPNAFLSSAEQMRNHMRYGRLCSLQG